MASRFASGMLREAAWPAARGADGHEFARAHKRNSTDRPRIGHDRGVRKQTCSPTVAARRLGGPDES